MRKMRWKTRRGRNEIRKRTKIQEETKRIIPEEDEVGSNETNCSTFSSSSLHIT